MEIGSEFWLDDLDYSNISSTNLPSWLTKYGQSILCSSGRGAITLLLDHIEPIKKSVLLPKYICESVIAPFIRRGYTCYYYDINHDLTPRISTIDINKDVGVFLHLGYFGINTNCKLYDVIKKLKANSTLIIEDVTHTLFSNHTLFSENDYYIGSIRKWLGIPSGGFLASNYLPISADQQENINFVNIRKKALKEKSNYINYGVGSKKNFLNLFSEAEKLLDKNIEPYNIDDLSYKIIQSLDANSLYRQRRINFKHLHDKIKTHNFLNPVFNSLPNGTCPTFYPLYVNYDRKYLRDKLAHNDIYCPIHWPVPENIYFKKNDRSSYIYGSILSIPCDQRYTKTDMDKILSLIE